MPAATATDLIAEACERATFDELMARDPATLSRADRLAMIEHFRAERVAWLAKEEKASAKKEAKKQGQDPDPE